MDAEVVDRAGQDPVRLAVEQEVGVADGEAHGVTLSGNGAVRKDPHGPEVVVERCYFEVTLKPCSLPYFTIAFCQASSPAFRSDLSWYAWPTVSA